LACDAKKYEKTTEETTEEIPPTFSQRPVVVTGGGSQLTGRNMPVNIVTIERWTEEEEKDEGVVGYVLYSGTSPIPQDPRKRQQRIPLLLWDGDALKFSDSTTVHPGVEIFYAATALNKDGVESAISSSQRQVAIVSAIPRVVGLWVDEVSSRGKVFLVWEHREIYDTHFLIFRSKEKGFDISKTNNLKIFVSTNKHEYKDSYFFEEDFPCPEEGESYSFKKYYYQVVRVKTLEDGSSREVFSPPSEEVETLVSFYLETCE